MGNPGARLAPAKRWAARCRTRRTLSITAHWSSQWPVLAERRTASNDLRSVLGVAHRFSSFVPNLGPTVSLVQAGAPRRFSLYNKASDKPNMAILNLTPQ